MTLPLVLLTLDLFPLRRSVDRAVLIEKAWYLLPAIGAAAMAAYAQAASGALRTLNEHPLSLRIAQACYGVLFYLGKTLWPADLVPLYEQRPDATAMEPIFIACGVGVLLLSVIAWRLRRTMPAILATWIAYLVLLCPMLGFTQSGPQVVADRYSYLPSMALMTLAGGVMVRCWSGERWRRLAVIAVTGLVVLPCIVTTRDQIGIWKNTRTLWETTLARRPDTPLARANYAVELNRAGEFPQATGQARLALERLPGNRTAHAALAHAVLELGELETAERHGRIALEIAEKLGRPDIPTMTRMIVILSLLGRLEEAETVRRRLVELDPSFANWHFDPAKRKWATQASPE
jgi:tetratricopeptide (TPR) repeat protein